VGEFTREKVAPELASGFGLSRVVGDEKLNHALGVVYLSIVTIKSTEIISYPNQI